MLHERYLVNRKLGQEVLTAKSSKNSEKIVERTEGVKEPKARKGEATGERPKPSDARRRW